MPRIRAPSSPAAIAAHAREFALLKQLPVSGEGDVDAAALSKLIAKYGSKKDVTTDDLSFEDFAALFSKPSSAAESGEGNCIGYAVFSPEGELKPWRFNRRAPRADDVTIQITHAGICHSDIHQARNEWANSTYPMVPGHEIAGIVTAVGPNVTKFKVGDRVGVGCMVGSCGSCDSCSVKGEEQYCTGTGLVGTYNSVDPVDGTNTYGGYSTHVLVKESFVLHIPDALPLEDTAPLLCAGITVYSPITTFGLNKPGLHVGVVGLGGLGHMAVKFLKAFGVTVSVISTSPGKKEEALGVLGADHFIVSKDEEQMKAATGKLDGIIDSVSAAHDLLPLISMLKVDGTLVQLGVPPTPPTLPVGPLIFGRKRIAGSLIGGIKATQDMLDFCAEKGIACMSEFIPIEYVNTAYERVVKGDVRYRFVIDVQGSLHV